MQGHWAGPLDLAGGPISPGKLSVWKRRKDLVLGVRGAISLSFPCLVLILADRLLSSHSFQGGTGSEPDWRSVQGDGQLLPLCRRRWAVPPRCCCRRFGSRRSCSSADPTPLRPLFLTPPCLPRSSISGITSFSSHASPQRPTDTLRRWRGFRGVGSLLRAAPAVLCSLRLSR